MLRRQGVHPRAAHHPVLRICWHTLCFDIFSSEAYESTAVFLLKETTTSKRKNGAKTIDAIFGKKDCQVDMQNCKHNSFLKCQEAPGNL